MQGRERERERERTLKCKAKITKKSRAGMSFSGASKILVKTSGETGELFIQNTQKNATEA
jgi:hypothetical protein